MALIPVLVVTLSTFVIVQLVYDAKPVTVPAKCSRLLCDRMYVDSN
jgi:hypothetical protein